ncbi:MAG: hypothetical protein K8R54_18005 [Bacteroidales bacterium]|nr:hypothetical protein [Bacteroidales bacterium]
MKNSPEIKEFIKENSSLFWYIPEEKKQDISHEVLVEFILNYGDEKSVKKLFNLLEINYVADIFYKQTQRKRVNYFPQVTNFFNLYFQKYAH